MAAHIDVSESIESSDSTSAQEDSVRICELCLKHPSKYKCPKCNVFYCSLTCYRGKKHSGCSENFYKGQFMEVMKEKRGSEDDRKRMLEILQRVDAEYKPLFDEEGAEIEEDEEEGEPVEALEERLEGLDLDKDVDLVWDRLTTKERTDFEKHLRAGNLGSLVPIWKPWWEQHDQSLVKEVNLEPATPEQPSPTQPPPTDKPKEPTYADEIELDLAKMAKDLGLETGDETAEQESPLVEASSPCQCPTVLKKISKLEDLLRNKKPSECVAYNLLNILYSYAYAVRLYNGAHTDLPVQVAQNILELSSTLRDNANFEQTEDALSSAIHNSSKSLTTSSTLSTYVLRDVSHILLGGASDSPIGYAESALSDMHRLFGAAKKQLSKESKQLPPSASSSGSRKADSSREAKTQLQRTCFNCQKKLEFLLAWLVDNQDRPRLLMMEVESMHRSRQLLDKQHDATKSALEKEWGGKRPPTKTQNRLIEELS